MDLSCQQNTLEADGNDILIWKLFTCAKCDLWYMWHCLSQVNITAISLMIICSRLFVFMNPLYIFPSTRQFIVSSLWIVSKWLDEYSRHTLASLASKVTCNPIEPDLGCNRKRYSRLWSPPSNLCELWEIVQESWIGIPYLHYASSVL